MNYDTDDFYDLLRNRHYKIEMAPPGGTIDHPGADTEEEAINGTYSLKCRIVPWNEVVEDVHVPGIKRLTVDTRRVVLHRAVATTTGQTLSVTTENTGGWSITDVPSWLTVSPAASTADGTDNITIKSNGTSIFNQGSFKLKAGNAEMAIKVKLGMFPLEYVAEYNLAGGAQYGASFSSSSNPPDIIPTTTAQSDSILRWATGHENDQSGYYNWYVVKGIHHSTSNPEGKNLFDDTFFKIGNPGHGYHLPSRWEWTSVFSYFTNVMYNGSTNASNINEACEFGDIKQTFASDYFSWGSGICYALRFKKATNNPNDGSPTSGSGSDVFPWATDNSMCCAYRYERVGVYNSTFGLKVQCVYLGSEFTGDINTIRGESWWNDIQATTPDRVVTRFFPVAGYLNLAHASSDTSTLYNWGNTGFYWSTLEYNPSFAEIARFNWNNAYIGRLNKAAGCSVRLFASE